MIALNSIGKAQLSKAGMHGYMSTLYMGAQNLRIQCMGILYTANRPKYCHNLMQGLAWATEISYIRRPSLATKKKESRHSKCSGQHWSIFQANFIKITSSLCDQNSPTVGIGVETNSFPVNFDKMLVLPANRSPTIVIVNTSS